MIKEKCLSVYVMAFKLDNYGFEILRFKERWSPTDEVVQRPILSSKTRTTSLTDFGFPVEYKDIRRKQSTVEASQQTQLPRGLS